MTLRMAFIVAVTAFLSNGCMTTTYRSMDEPAAEPSPLERPVDYFLSDQFFQSPPLCAAVWAAPNNLPAEVQAAIQRSVERNMAVTFSTIRTVDETISIARRLAVDLTHPGDRRVFGRQTRCGALMEITMDSATDNFAVLWAQRGLGLSLRLIRSSDSELLWAARHFAQRMNGGLPLSLISIPFTIARASSLANDKEAFDSIADDAVRRMIKTLPNLRAQRAATHGSFNPRND